jgi:hypothetical protein
MASLIFAASYLTYNKIKSKREEKKAKKRKTYEDRYHQLEREHAEGAEKQLQGRSTGSSNMQPELPNSPTQSAELRGRRSSESLGSEEEKKDGPSAWVDEVVKDRSGVGTQTLPTTAHGDFKRQSFV